MDYGKEVSTIEFIQHWARGFVALVILMGLVELLLPPDSLRSYVRMVLGLLLLVALVRPIIHELPGMQRWEPTLTTASTTGLEQVMKTGELIRERGGRAASDVIKDNLDLIGILRQRLPNLQIYRIEKSGGRIKIHLPETVSLDEERKVIQTISQLGWDKKTVEVIRDGRSWSSFP